MSTEECDDIFSSHMLVSPTCNNSPVYYTSDMSISFFIAHIKQYNAINPREISHTSSGVVRYLTFGSKQLMDSPPYCNSLFLCYTKWAIITTLYYIVEYSRKKLCLLLSLMFSLNESQWEEITTQNTSHEKVISRNKNCSHKIP